MPVEAILFDLDDTLIIDQIAAETSFRVTCEQASKRLGCNPDQLTRVVWDKAHNLWHAAPTIKHCLDLGIGSWEGLWSRFSGDNPNLRYLREWAPSYRRQVWFQALSEFGIKNEEFAQQFADTLIKERQDRHFLFSDSRECLVQLSDNYRMGIITNGPSDFQREKIEKTHIGEFFDAVIISGEVGIGKPDRGIFDLALRKLGVNPEEAVLVGDNLERDIKGAQNVGIRAVWINRNRLIIEDQKVVPDAQITSLNELLGVLNFV